MYLQGKVTLRRQKEKMSRERGIAGTKVWGIGGGSLGKGNEKSLKKKEETRQLH